MEMYKLDLVLLLDLVQSVQERLDDGSNYTEVTFTPDANADVEVKTIMTALRPEKILR